MYSLLFYNQIQCFSAFGEYWILEYATLGFDLPFLQVFKLACYFSWMLVEDRRLKVRDKGLITPHTARIVWTPKDASFPAPVPSMDDTKYFSVNFQVTVQVAHLWSESHLSL